MYYVGLDVHWRQSTYCILDEDRGRVKLSTVRGSWDKLIGELEKIDGELIIAYEASCGYGTLYDRLSGLANVRSVVVAHPGQLRLIFKSKRKNDRVDAKKLAMLLLIGEMPMVYVPSLNVRSWRRLIEYRSNLVNRRTRVKNSIRSMLRGCGIVMPRGLWTKRGVVWLKEVELPTLMHKLERDQLIDELAYHEKHIREVECELNRIGRSHGGVNLLQSMPGVGARTSEAVVAYVDRPERFVKNKSIGSYFGLVPSQDSSGSVNRLGHITREGPSTVRRLVTEAAWQGIRHSPQLRRHFDRIVNGRDERKKIALVATAHYMLRVMLAMLRSGECWREAA